MPKVVNRKMRHTRSSQCSFPRSLHAADRPSGCARAGEDVGRIGSRLFFPFAQHTISQICKRERFGRPRCLYAIPKANETMLPIDLVPTQPESFGIGSSSRLNEQNNTHAKMRRSRL